MDEESMDMPSLSEPDMAASAAAVPVFDEDAKMDDSPDDVSNSNEVGSSSRGKQERAVLLINRPDFDLEALVSSYKSDALFIRLMYIAEVCPGLRAEAFKTLIEQLVATSQNVHSYSVVYQKVEAYKAVNELPHAELIPPMDCVWMEDTASKSNARLDLLNAEFRRQKDDGVKESIRRAMDDVFQQHLAMGNTGEALKLYARGIREYCTAPHYLIHMLLNWISATVYAEQWAKLNVLIPQAERAVSETVERDGASAARELRHQPRSMTDKGRKELIASSTAKLSAVSGLSAIKCNNFRMAADKFMAVELDTLDYPELLASSDIAAFGTVCALATYSRKELKERVLGSSSFRKFLEAEPKFVELLQKFCANEFGAALDILEQIRDVLLLNVYLAPHVADLYTKIRRHAIVQYFEPFLSADMHVMAREFRTSVDELERELIDLIRSDSLSARIDASSKVLTAKAVDRQSDIFQRTLKFNKDLSDTVNAILIRSALQQQGVYVGLQETYHRRRREVFDGPEQGPSTGSKMMATMRSLFNVGTSRIHPSVLSADTSSAAAGRGAEQDEQDENEQFPAPSGNGRLP